MDRLYVDTYSFLWGKYLEWNYGSHGKDRLNFVSPATKSSEVAATFYLLTRVEESACCSTPSPSLGVVLPLQFPFPPPAPVSVKLNLL